MEEFFGRPPLQPCLRDEPVESNTAERCFTTEEILKYDKYEANYASYLRAKFFSDKDIYGGDIFDLAVTVGDEPIKASRWSPTQSYVDPAQSSAAEKPSASAMATESSPNIPNGNATPSKKSS